MSGAVAVSSISAAFPPVPNPVISRKRTMSFSSPQPLKSARTLRRTGSYLSLSDMQAADTYESQQRASTSAVHCVPYHRTLRHYKEQRDRRKAVGRTCGETMFVVGHQPVQTPVSSSKPCLKTPFPRQRSSSPLSPTRSSLPVRASFPRSKPEPDLYRVAITTRMRLSPEGQQILHLGPHLALSLCTATKELERIVAAAQSDSDSDVAMSGGDAPLSKSWIVVPPEDWEMIDCSS